MLITPLVPAYANEAPLADRVASDVAEIVADVGLAETTPTPESALAAVSESGLKENVSAQESSVAVSEIAQVDLPVGEPASVVSGATESTAAPEGPAVDVGSSTSAPSAAEADDSVSLPIDTEADDSVSPSSDAVVTEAGGSGAGEHINSSPDVTSGTSASSTADVPSESIAAITDPFATTSDVAIAVDESAQTDSMASTTEDGETPIFDIAPDAVISNVEAIRMRLRNEMRGELRNEVRDEVRQEVRREVEEEVYRGCKNLDGTGYYCIPDAKSFGSPVIENERAIEVVVQPDPLTGNKQIFLVRKGSTIQLTHGTDDNVFPVLDPLSDTLVWQSLQSGKWQVAYAHMGATGVPKVEYLTNGENNFNPKIYAGRIAWQAWIDGNWEIFTATALKEKIPEEALSAEHRAAGISGDWMVRRVTANNAPDMFPNITGETITWQAVDGGVWQVFAYDIATGVAHRVSKPGVKSDSPKVALLWNEEDANGQMRMVGTSVDGAESFDLTALARRIVDNTKGEPKSPVSNTEIVVVAPVTVRTESEATSTPPVN
jgi:hypothetical protein